MPRKKPSGGPKEAVTPQTWRRFMQTYIPDEFRPQRPELSAMVLDRHGDVVKMVECGSVDRAMQQATEFAMTLQNTGARLGAGPPYRVRAGR